ncbi:MAG TPA: hypothetical protein GXX36_01995 [Clostridiaceae bacterium]|nr:hypothetical protein [Clostridiaceae bacterium]
MAALPDLLITAISGAVVCIAGLTVSLLSEKLSKQKKESEDLIKRIAKVASDDPVDVNKDLMKNSLIEELISSYHKQALSQAGIQFYFSVVAAAIGFGIIAYMVFSKSTSSEFEVVLKSLPGVAISSVAGLFFKQAGETRKRATELYDRLRIDKQMKQAMLLVGSIDDHKVKSLIQAQMVLNLAGVKYDSISMTDLLNKVYNSNETKN